MGVGRALFFSAMQMAESAHVSQVGAACFSAEAMQSRRRQSKASRRTSAPLVSQMPGMVSPDGFDDLHASDGLAWAAAWAGVVDANQWAGMVTSRSRVGGRGREAAETARQMGQVAEPVRLSRHFTRPSLIHSRGWRSLGDACQIAVREFEAMDDRRGQLTAKPNPFASAFSPPCC